MDADAATSEATTSEARARSRATVAGEVDGGLDDDTSLLSARERTENSSKNDVVERDVRFRITGMTCSACVGTVERAMMDARGVARAAAATATGEARAVLDDEANEREVIDAIVREVESCGFDCEPMESVNERRSGGGSSAVKTVKLAVDGMTCSACSGAVENALRAVVGVSSATVSVLPYGAAIVVYDSNATGARDFIEAVEEIGFGASVYHSAEDDGSTTTRELSRFREDLKLAMSLTAPIVLMNLIVERIWTPKLGRLSLWVLVKFALASRVQFGVGMRFHRGAWNSLKRGASNMDVLVSLGTNVAYGVSVGGVLSCLSSGSMCARDYFDTSALLITFILIGKYLETSARGKTSTAITKLLELTPSEAVRLVPTKMGEEIERRVATELIQVGDLLKVLPGARVPADGVIIRGDAYVDESMITGEPMPVMRKMNGRITGGTINEGNAFVMRAERLGADSTLHQIVRLVEDAQLSKAPIQAFADRLSNVFVPFIVVLAMVTFFSWLVAGWTGSIPAGWIPADENKTLFAMWFGVAVLVTACPCALGLATPTAIMVGTSVAAGSGILVKGGEAMEVASRLDVVAFDKTGTLTTGSPTVVAFKSTRPENLDYIISVVVSIEKDSEHPIAKAVRDYSRRRSPTELALSAKSEVQIVAGQGVCCVVNGIAVAVGNGKLMSERGMKVVSKDIEDFTVEHEDFGHTVVLVGIGNAVDGAFAVSDELRPDAKDVVAALRERGIKSVMVTGDNWKTARAIANACGIEEFHAEASPADKVAFLKKLQGERSPRSKNKFEASKVAMVGDGINDAPSLAAADLSMAIGAGTDVAIEAADLVLMHADLYTVVRAVDISQKTFRQIRQNYVWALSYNVIALPLAAGCFYPTIKVPPWVASILMAISSISVVLASLSLKRKCREQRHTVLRSIEISSAA